MLLLSACALPQERTKSIASTEKIAASNNLTVRRALEVFPEMAIKIAEWGTNVVTRPLPALPAMRETMELQSESGTSAGSHEAEQTKKTWPLWIKLLGSGAGIILLTVGITYALRALKTTALGQGISLADKLAADQIRKLRERACLATDPAMQAHHLADIAALESERGKLRTA